MLNKKVEIGGSYFFNNSNNTNNEISSREYFGNVDSIRVDEENSISKSRNTNHRVNLRVEYKIDSNNSIMITPSINFQSNRSFNNFTAENYYRPNNLISESVNNNNSYSEGYNVSNNVLYRHAFAKRGRTVSLNLNTGFNKRDRESYVDAINNYYKGGSITDTDSLQQFSDQMTNGYQLSANLAYTEPLGKKGQLQISYNPSYSKNKADQQTFRFNEGESKYSLFDSSLSNKYDNNYTAQRAGISYRIGDRDNMFSIGASYQYARLEGDQVFPDITFIGKTFSNILPDLMWRKKLSAKSNIRLFYRGTTNEPSITQLQNVINNNNPLMISTGNPDLQQQYTHRLITRYSFTNSAKAQSIFANLFC